MSNYLLEKIEKMGHPSITVRLNYIDTITIILSITKITITINISIVNRCENGEYGELVIDSDRSDPSQA